MLDNQWVFIYYFNVDAIRVNKIVAWLSLVERCVRDAEVASSNLVATTKNTPSHMCEGVFLFLQLFKLTTSNWFGHTVRAQRAHEVRGTSALSRPKRSGDPRGPGDLGLDRPKRSGDPRGPGDLGFEPTGAERRPQVRILSISMY